jgi:ATP-dependent RNA helicase DeaD
LEGGELDLFRAVVASLSDQFDPADVAVAAVKLAHRAHGGDRVEEEIPPMPVRVPEPHRMMRREASQGERPHAARHREGQGRPFGRSGHPGRAGHATNMARLYIGAGRTAGIRPGDLVGAIANEAGVNASMIGGIDVQERFSLVEVPEGLARGIIEALGRTRMKGQKVAVRLFRESVTG